MTTNRVLMLAALGEIATGIALLIVPSLVVRLLFGGQLDGGAVPLARVVGIALMGLGVGCWPGPALIGMLTYSALVTVYLVYVGVASHPTGVLLWPAVIVHLIMAALLVCTAARERRARA